MKRIVYGVIVLYNVQDKERLTSVSRSMTGSDTFWMWFFVNAMKWPINFCYDEVIALGPLCFDWCCWCATLLPNAILKSSSLNLWKDLNLINRSSLIQYEIIKRNYMVYSKLHFKEVGIPEAGRSGIQDFLFSYVGSFSCTTVPFIISQKFKSFLDVFPDHKMCIFKIHLLCSS